MIQDKNNIYLVLILNLHDDLRRCLLVVLRRCLPDINTRTSLVAISFVKGEIKIFQNIT